MEQYQIMIVDDYAKMMLEAIIPACPGEVDLAFLLANRAYSRNIKLEDVRGKNRHQLIERIMIKLCDDDEDFINKYLVSYKFVENGCNGYGDLIFESQNITEDDIQDIKDETGKPEVGIVSIFKLDDRVQKRPVTK